LLKAAFSRRTRWQLSANQILTIAQWKKSSWAGNPGYLALCEQLYEGAPRGMPEDLELV